jgi:hypothetical protein
MGQAQSTANNPNAFKQYTGTVLADLNGTSQNALQNILNLSQQPVANLGQANSFVGGMLADNGMTGDLRQAAGYLQPFANGSMQEDPRFQQMLDTNANRAAMQGASMASAKGRYGSGAMGTDMADRIGEANNALMYQNNQAARQQQLQASGMLGDLYGSASNRAMGAMQMVPTLDALKYAGADRAAQVGDFYQQRAQDERNAQIQQQNEAYGVPKAQSEWLSGILNGMGKLGGSSSGTSVDYGKKKSGAEQLAGGLGLLGLFL